MAQLEQEYMLAQIISSFPNNVDGQPDVTTPAPIRSKWAHRLYQQGVRVHSELATHQSVAYGSGVTGNHGPRAFQKIDNDKMLAMIQRSNPPLYERIIAVRNSHHGGPAAMDGMLQQVLNHLPEEWIEKLQKADVLSGDYANANIPPPDEEAPTG